MVSEVASIFAITGGASVAVIVSKRHPDSLGRLLSLSVVACLFNFVFLGVSGFLRESDDFIAALHAVTGHLMLPLVAAAAGLWLGASFPEIQRRPGGVLLRLFFLVVLCFCCLSNTWTGYLGPSRVAPQIDPENDLRFKVIHRLAVPLLIGTMLLFWLLRLAAPAPSEGLKEPVGR
jgi:hypothetical protein